MPIIEPGQIATITDFYSNFLQKLSQKVTLDPKQQKEAIAKAKLLCDLVKRNTAIKLSEEQEAFFTHLSQALEKMQHEDENEAFTAANFAKLMQIMQQLLGNLPPGTLPSELIQKMHDVYEFGQNIIKIWGTLSNSEKRQLTIGMVTTIAGVGLLIASLANPANSILILAGLCINVGYNLCKKALANHKEPEALTLTNILGQLATITSNMLPKGFQAVLPSFMSDHTQQSRTSGIVAQTSIPVVEDWQQLYTRFCVSMSKDTSYKIVTSVGSGKKAPYEFTIAPKIDDPQKQTTDQIHVQYTPSEKNTKLSIKSPTPTDDALLQMLEQAKKFGDVLTLDGSPELLSRAIKAAHAHHIPNIRLTEHAKESLEAAAKNNPGYADALRLLEHLTPHCAPK